MPFFIKKNPLVLIAFLGLKNFFPDGTTIQILTHQITEIIQLTKIKDSSVQQPFRCSGPNQQCLVMPWAINMFERRSTRIYCIK